MANSFEKFPKPSPEKPSEKPAEPESENKEILFRKVTQGLKEEFSSILTSAGETTLNQLSSKIVEVRDSHDFYRKMNGIDLATFFRGEESFLDTEGMIGINPYTLETVMIHKNLEGEPPKAIADKICHEAIHELGFQLEEVKKIQDDRESFEFELLKDYVIEVVLPYKFGPLRNLAFLYQAKSAPELKILLYMPTGDVRETAFWEGVVDYYSKRIVEKLNLTGDYTAGYDQRVAIAYGRGAIANLISEKTESQYEVNIEKLDRAFKIALLSGNESGLSELVNLLTPQELKMRLEKISDRLKNEVNLVLGERFSKSIPQLLENSEIQTTYTYFKDFVANFAEAK